MIVAILATTLALTASAAPPAHRASPPSQSLVPDIDTEVDVNESSMYVTNLGSWAYDMVHGDAGLEWPQDSGKTVVFAGGLWLGATVNGDVRVTVGEYSQEYAAGPLDANGDPLDPDEIDPAHKVYKINAGDGPENPDWVNWPVQYGAPVDSLGAPLVLGDQTLWCVYNDAVASKHNNDAGFSAPLGVEVRQTAYAFDESGALGKTIVVDFEIENKGGNLLEEMYVALWYDPDLGGGTDDFVGCDSTRSLGYCYNATNEDGQYGAHPPALGCQFLKGPIVGGDTLGMTSFNKFINGTDPGSRYESYNYMQGLTAAGDPQTCDGQPSRFVLTGDPVAGTSCLDHDPADRRMMMSAGPFTMVPGDTQHVVVAIIVGGVYEIGDRLSNVSLLRFYSEVVQDAFDHGFDPSLNQYPFCTHGGPYTGNAGEPLLFDGSGSFDPDGSIVDYAWDFGDGGLGSGPTPTHVYTAGGVYNVLLTLTDDAGAEAYCLTNASIYEPTGVGDFTDVTITGMQEVEYLNIDPTHRRALSWVNWGGRFFGGSFDSGCLWSGSTIVGEVEEMSNCPGAEYAPERFGTVELRFDATQKGYRYLRRETEYGSSPSVGRGYTYAGYDDLICTVWKVVGNTETQLQTMYVERQITDDLGNPLPGQPESQNALWQPTTEGNGGREYLTILDVPYSPTPLPEYMDNGIFFSSNLPALYGGWLRHRAEGDVIDPDDKFVIFYLALGDEGSGSEAAWVDFDADGDHDLHLANNGSTDHLYRSDGGGTFIDLLGTPLSDEGQAVGARWGDFDNDHDPDLYLAIADGTNRLLRNDDGESFVDVAAGPLSSAGSSNAVSWVDVDLDGDLDLYVGEAGGANQLLRNDGGESFVDVTVGPLGGDAVDTNDAAWSDFDGDGDFDVYLVNSGPNRLLRNDGGVFVVVGGGGLGGTQGSEDADWGDYDGDQDLDLYLANQDGANLLFRNDGGSTFTDVTAGPLGDPSPSNAVSWIDIDNDADLDLYVVNGPAPNTVLENQGGEFVEALIPVLQDPEWGTGAAWSDHDADGDADVFLANHGANKLLRNEVELTRWLQVDLIGAESNAAGIGAKIWVKTGDTHQLQEVAATSGNATTAEFGLGGAFAIDRIVVRWPSAIVQAFYDLDLDQRLTVEENAATAVDLLSFQAVGAAGQVTLSWETVDGTPLGFHLWRADAGETTFERLTGEPLRNGPQFRYIDRAVVNGEVYDYELEIMEAGGGRRFLGPVRGMPLARPLRLALRQNVPNPFNPSTSIGYELPERADVTLTIYDPTGRVVHRLVDCVQEPGIYDLLWDGRNAAARLVASGVYFYRLEVGDWTRARKMLLIR